MVEIEQATPPRFHPIGICKRSPTRATDVGSINLVGDYNTEGPGLGDHEEVDFKCSLVADVSPNMIQEVTPCVAWDGLSKIIRN
jgi:hypothetical protein